MILAVSLQGQYSECVYTKAVFQHIKDVSMQLTDYPDQLSARIRISNSREDGNAVEYTVTSNPFEIPDGYFASGSNVYLWFEAADSQALVVIPVMRMPAPVPLPGEGGGTSVRYDEEHENLIFGGGIINSTNDGSDDEDTEEEEDMGGE